MSVEPRPRERRDPFRGIASLALALLEILLCLSIFGPQPLAWLWVGSQVDFVTDSLSSGLAVAFIGSAVTIVATVWAGKRLERVWSTLNPERAEQGRSGLFETAFVISTVIAVIGFALWFFVFAGPGPTIAPDT
jgi:hypothetical protein